MEHTLRIDDWFLPTLNVVKAPTNPHQPTHTEQEAAMT